MLEEEIKSYIAWRLKYGRTVNGRGNILWRLDKFCQKSIWEITSSDFARFEKSLSAVYSQKDTDHIVDVITDFKEYCSHLFYMNGKILWYVDVSDPKERLKGGAYVGR
jgi:hypothetical protein